MPLTISQENAVSIFAIEGRLDAQGIKDLEAAVQHALSEGSKSLLFDFSQLDYINSSGLRILVMAYQQLTTQQGTIAICGTRDYIQEIFDISGYNKIFAMFPDKEQAMAHF